MLRSAFRSTRARAVLVLALSFAGAAGGCAIVPAYQRETLADPAMDPAGTALEARSFTKLHETRESAGGGDGRPAGGGCGCGN
jgi:hypothetical protein